MPRERKPLIAPGSVLPPQEPGQSGGDVMSRIIARDREKRLGDEEAPSVPKSAGQENKPTSSSNSNITDNTIGNITGNKNQQEEDGAGSITDQIRQSLLQSVAPAPLKVVTLKLPPELDQKIEDHCGRYNRKKQDVLRDAVLLYFEMLENMEAESNGKVRNTTRHPTADISR